MIRLVVSSPVFDRSNVTSVLTGYNYRIVYMDVVKGITLTPDEKVMFALPVDVSITVPS